MSKFRHRYFPGRFLGGVSNTPPNFKAIIPFSRPLRKPLGSVSLFRVEWLPLAPFPRLSGPEGASTPERTPIPLGSPREILHILSGDQGCASLAVIHNETSQQLTPMNTYEHL